MNKHYDVKCVGLFEVWSKKVGFVLTNAMRTDEWEMWESNMVE